MNKKAQEALVAAKTIISDQKAELTKRNELIADLNKYKLAYDIASALTTKDQLDPADFQDSFQQLLEKSAEDLSARAKILSVMDITTDLDLGVLDDRDKNKTGSAEFADSAKSPTPHSQTSTDAGRRMIEHTIND